MSFLGIDLKKVVAKAAPKIVAATVHGGTADEKDLLMAALASPVFQPVFDKFGQDTETGAKIGAAIGAVALTAGAGAGIFAGAGGGAAAGAGGGAAVGSGAAVGGIGAAGTGVAGAASVIKKLLPAALDVKSAISTAADFFEGGKSTQQQRSTSPLVWFAGIIVLLLALRKFLK